MPQSASAAGAPDDLGALSFRLQTMLAEREAPILDAHGLSMWEYVILGRLASQEAMTQKQLADSSRRDPTRLGANLDALEERALIERHVDEDDRRRRLVRLTRTGYEVWARVRSEIATMEESVLGTTSETLRSALVVALQQFDQVQATPR